jgi:hypothetical protein
VEAYVHDLRILMWFLLSNSKMYHKAAVSDAGTAALLCPAYLPQCSG